MWGECIESTFTGNSLDPDETCVCRVEGERKNLDCLENKRREFRFAIAIHTTE